VYVRVGEDVRPAEPAAATGLSKLQVRQVVSPSPSLSLLLFYFLSSSPSFLPRAR